MKKLLIMCGSGIATSTVAAGKVKQWLKDNNLEDEVKIYQSKIAEEVNHIDDYDAVITTTTVPDNIKDKVIFGLPLLTNMGIDQMWDQLKKELEK
ncbi:MAG: PTS sugar transporter subunit IIB [Anaerococcus vaginalis]|uniref:PTS sugar transporter subunit IIB n=1 Tax=Anaerococcus jeddahensis TaxID=1673719 RepID=UPI0006726862|nr:PTS sugar transporter subunit IIB [Anaerococcus jeddahensis]KWZ93686.1 PTS system, Lactose/Cellobiose specific IIB subunit [Anaerococcus hydrogenalis]MDU2829260.1 PTS sugar transporter subunit IIB [Anaerococcus sp.]MDU5913698.1 PTS sugar transporter subunit IIB [Anaerococcus vaginalis]